MMPTQRHMARLKGPRGASQRATRRVSTGHLARLNGEPPCLPEGVWRHRRVIRMPGSILGTQVRRVEDEELLLGQGAFVDNLDSDGVAHAVFVRSPFAHARITGIDTAEAGAADGVVAVHTADDLGREGVPSFADVNSPDMGSMMTETPHVHRLD